MPVFINEAAIRSALTEKEAFRLALEVFQLMARKKTRMPPKLYLNLPSGNDFRAMPAFIETTKGKGVSGIKWVSVFPENPKKGRATVNATILLSSADTGETSAVLEANTITALRTAACAAVATHYLANPNPRELAIVGAGLQAAYQLKALATQTRFSSIRVWGSRPGEANRFRAQHPDFPIIPCENIRSCVEGADVLVTCTPSRKPLVRKGWVKKGAHINAIGADAKGKEELDPALLLSSKVVADEWEQASHSGEINVPVAKKLFLKKNLYAELSEVISGKKKGRIHPDEITIFDSTGIALLDVYFAQYICAKLKKIPVS